MDEEKKETYMLTVNRRNKLWDLIQKAYDRRIDEEVSRILADGHAIGRDMLDTLKDIDERTAELENCKTAWERLLHGGKTMQDINKEIREKFDEIDDKFYSNSPFGGIKPWEKKTF